MNTAPITISGATSNDYTGGTTINRGTVYLAKTGGAIAIAAGNVNVNCSPTSSTGQTYLILNGSNEIASTAMMNFSGVYGVRNRLFRYCSATARRWPASMIRAARA